MSDDVDDNEFEGTGIIVPDPADNPDNMDRLAHAVLDDVLFNIIHDILLKTHREVKTAKANTAAILIEQEAAQQFEGKSTPDSLKTTPTKQPHRIENEAAIYEDGVVYIKGNPLANVKEIRCPKCGLPKLLHPTDGNGARKPEEGKVYCGRHPFVSKPGHDIYGVPFPKEDVGGKKTAKDKPKPANNLLKAASSNANGSQNDSTTIESSFSSPGPSPPPNDQYPKTKSHFPNVECPNCGRSINVRVFARHLNNHLKGGGRASSRAAMAKINGDKGSQNGSTPPGSRRGTPSVSGVKGSPHKRSAEDFEGDDDEDRSRTSSDEADDDEDARPKKKKRRKNPGAAGTPAPGAATTSSTEAKPKLKLKVKDPVGSGSSSGGVVKKWKSGKVTVDGKPVDPGRILPPTKPEKETKILPPPPVKPRKMGGGPREHGELESSQTMSSPAG